MRLFSSWWERIPRRYVAQILLTALAVTGALDHGAIIRAVVGPHGFVWG